jgi:hypothetical protein
MFNTTKFEMPTATQFVEVYRKIADTTVKFISNDMIKGVASAATEYHFSVAERAATQYDKAVDGVKTKFAEFTTK